MCKWSTMKLTLLLDIKCLGEENMKMWKILVCGIPSGSGQDCMHSTVICLTALSCSYILVLRKTLIKRLNPTYGCFNVNHIIDANILYPALIQRRKRKEKQGDPIREPTRELWKMHKAREGDRLINFTYKFQELLHKQCIASPLCSKTSVQAHFLLIEWKLNFESCKTAKVFLFSKTVFL